jgi:hypothetical protein
VNEAAMQLLALALRAAKDAHSQYEQEVPMPHADEWPEWYAKWLLANTPYIVVDVRRAEDEQQ